MILGLNFVFRMQEETGSNVEEVANAYATVKGIFRMDTLWNEVEQLDNKVDAMVQLDMLDSMRRTLRRATRWYIRHGYYSDDIQKTINGYDGTFTDLESNLQTYLVESEYEELDDITRKYIEAGVPESIAYRVASLSNMFCVLDLSQVAEAEGRDIALVANLYYKLGSRLELHWFLDQINGKSVANHWQALARASYREELDWQQRSITSVLLSARQDCNDAEQILDDWIENNKILLDRWYHMMSEFKTSTQHEFAKFSVALRELMLLSVKANS